MSIATEIQRLRQAKTDIKSAIESKGVEVGDGTIDTYAGKINEISTGAGGDDYIYMPHLTRFGLESLNVFNKPTAVITIPKVTGYNEMLAAKTVANTTVQHLTVNGSQDKTITTAYNCFGAGGANDYTLKRLTLNCDFGAITDIRYCFYRLKALEIIDGIPIDLSGITSSTNADYAFTDCYALQEIRFKTLSVKIPLYFSASSKLSEESIQSIIDGLADLTGGTSRALTLNSTVGKNLTDSQKASVTAKNWTLVY